MLPAMDDAAPLPWRGHLAALGALRRRVAAQSSVDTAEGVKARRVLFSLGNPSGNCSRRLTRSTTSSVPSSKPPILRPQKPSD
ncbi:hypothetical protein ACVDG8_005795 [Mesorhizobium sp. ORM8.1]